jgi:hypothetical protein
MSDEHEKPENVPTAFDPVSGWCKVWHKRGVQVTVPLRGEISTFAEQIESLFAWGFTAECPGLEEGEEKDHVAYVLRGGSEHDGKVTPFVLLYSTNDAYTWSFLKVYMNKPEDIAAFEFASKTKLDKLPDYVGNDKPQRGASVKTDAYIVKVPKPFGVVFKKNPKHDDTEAGKMKPARLFVRWADMKPVSEQPTAAKPADAGDVNAKVMEELAARLAADPTVAAINDELLPWLRKQGRETAIAGFKKVKDTLELHGVRWDKERKIFHTPAAANNAEFDEFAGSV